MADKGFNGSTISFGGDQVPLRDINYDEAAAEVQVTGAADARHGYEAGIPDPTATFSIVGGSSVSVGDTGDVIIAWNDGTSDSLGTSIITGRSTTGSLDGEILSNVTVRPQPI